jgi:diguanylate cyclase (GGDEF)-like protein/PAS domain S-box-containing protein
MKSGWTIRAQLFLLIAAVALPLLALVAYNAYRDFSSQREIVSASGRTLAEITAAETSRFLHDTQTALASLSQRPRVRALDPQRCDPALRDYLDAHPYFANVLTVDVSGRVVCSVAAVPSGVSTVTPDFWPDKLIQAEAFTLGKPSRGLITGKRVVVLAYPLRDSGGKFSGGVGLPIDLARFAPLAGKSTLPPDASILIMNGDGTRIASSDDAQTEIGKDARGSEIVDIVLARRQGEARAVGADGIERLYAFLPIPGVDWYAYAGIPVSAAFAELNQRTLQSAAIGILIVLLALALAVAAARAVISPVTAIGKTARKLQGGDRDARFRLEGPVEIAQVLEQFNRTLDVLAEDERRRRESENRFSEMIESVAEGIIGIDEQQRIVVFNAAAERMFGRSAAQVIGEPINTLLPERFRARHAEHIDRFTATGQTSLAMGRYGMIYGLRASGEEFPVEATISQSGASPDKLMTVILRDVTERRRVEEAQARLAAIVQNSNDAIIGRSLDHMVQSWNPAAERMFGYTAAEIIGEGISLIIPPDREEEVAHNRALLAQGHALLDLETVRLAKGGRRIDVSLSQSPIRDERGTMVGVSLIFRDVSERKRAEQVQARLAAIVENSNDAIISRSIDRTILSWNRAAERMFGYTASEVIGQNMSLIIPAGREEEAARNGALIEKGGVLRDFETVRLAKDARRIDVSLSQSLVKDESGTMLGVAVVYRDISERKQAEAALRKSEEQFRLIAENIDEVFWMTGVEIGRMFYISPAYERVWGRTRKSLEENPHSFFDAIHPEDRGRVIADREVRKTGQPFDHEYRITWPDGSVRWIWDRGYPVQDLTGQVTRYAGVAQDITERKQAEERIDYLAQYDPVTGLPNRRLFNDRLTLAMARDKRIGAMTALLLLDLDRFKTINETLGHSTGDKVLQAVTARLRDRLREVDTVARLGGDEFAVILESVTERAQASRVAEKVIEAMAEPFTLEGEELFITASIGVAVHPADADSIEKLIENAELAMYRAKADGRNAVNVFQQDHDKPRRAGLGMETRLRRAIERDELLLNFQPKVDIKTGAIAGAEALVRWRNPDLGLVSPADFIPLAEESGLIVPIGEWVLHSACAQASGWHRLGYPITVAVNLSARQFRQNDLCGMIALMLADTGLPAGKLELEITESMIMHRPEQTIATLQQLHDMGIILSVDDFGTGYSSLAYLKRFPVHTLKVDQSFVRDLHLSDDDSAIVRVIIALAKSLNLKTVAEGVETEQQLSFLAGLDCDEYQGYYFSKPLPAAEFMRLLQARGVAAATAVEYSS